MLRAVRPRRILLFLLAAGLLTLPLSAATFQFGTLIRVGFSATGGANWDFGAGGSSAAPTSTADVTPYYTNGTPVAFQVRYTKSTNTATLTVGGTSVNFNPAGGAAAQANAIWTLPAASFLVTALGPNLPNSVSVNSLSLTGIAGPVTILQPMLQTTLTANRPAFVTPTVSAGESQAIVFQGDSNGDWRLTGNIVFTGLLPPGFPGATGNDLTFGLNASAADVPEPAPVLTVFLGLAALGFRIQWNRRHLKAVARR